MSEKTEKKTVEKVEETEEVSTAEKKVAKKKEEKPMKEKKEGLFKRGKNWVKANKKAIIAGAVGVGTGVAGTLAVAELGKRSAERRERRNVTTTQENEISPLDPNY